MGGGRRACWAQGQLRLGTRNLSRLQDDGGGEGQVDKQELQAPRDHASRTLVSVVLSPSRGCCLCWLTSQVLRAHLRQTGRGRRSHTPAPSALRNSQPLAAVYGHQLRKAGQQCVLPGCSQSSQARQPPQGTQDPGGQADASLTARSSLARQPALPAARSSKPFPGRRWNPVCLSPECTALFRAFTEGPPLLAPPKYCRPWYQGRSSRS